MLFLLVFVCFMLVIELRNLCAIKLYFQPIIIISTMIKTSETHVSQYSALLYTAQYSGQSGLHSKILDSFFLFLFLF